MPFVKGKSGNPSGMSKAYKEFKRTCRKHSPEALRYMLEVMRGPEHEVSDRMKAAIWIAEQGHGKAAQGVELTPEGSKQVQAILEIVKKDAK